MMIVVMVLMIMIGGVVVMMLMTTGKGGACCAQTLAWVPLFHLASWVEDIVQDIHGLLANYNTPQTSTCAPYNFKGAPLQFVKICGHKYRGIGQKYKKLAPQIQSGLLCAIVRPWPTSFPALRGAELDFLKILAKISCLISQIPA